MKQFVVSARKYRPQGFDQVVGQKSITQTLDNAISNNHLAQALLFTGPRGVGKTTCARILAKKINQDIADVPGEAQHPDEDFAFNIFELDAASNNSVEDIRSLIDQVRIPPQTGRFKVYIIDEVHMLSSSAFNAFLKTLEEPPAHAIFILATTEKHKIISTILSRCQIFDFKRITVDDIKVQLQRVAEAEGIQAEDDALHLMALKADGAMRDALSIFDRIVSFCGNNITRTAVAENLHILDYSYYFTITDLMLEGQIPELLLQLDEILSQGFDGQHFINGLCSHFRDLLVAQTPQTIPLLEVGENVKQDYAEQSQVADRSWLMQALDIANQCALDYRNSRNPRLLTELCLMQLASLNELEQKKKPKRKSYITPASAFEAIPASKQVDKSPDHVEPMGGAHQTTPVKVTETQEEANTTIADELQPNESQQDQLKPDEPQLDKPEPAKPQDMARQATNPEMNQQQVTTSATTPQSQQTQSEQIQNEELLSEELSSEQSPNKVDLEEAQHKPTESKEKNLRTIDIQVGQVREGVSSFSLKSIQEKKELKSQQENNNLNPGEKRSKEFTYESFLDAWNSYAEQVKKQGKYNLYSHLSMEQPKIEHTDILLTFPNDTIRLELEREQGAILSYLGNALENDHLQLIINVVEEAVKRYAYTPQEKYEQLKEQNELLDVLRSTLDLDV